MRQFLGNPDFKTALDRDDRNLTARYQLAMTLWAASEKGDAIDRPPVALVSGPPDERGNPGCRRGRSGPLRPHFGQGKVDAAEKLAAQEGADLDQSFFYSDSTDDIQLLERIGQPIALNPSTKLERIARERQWPVGHFGSRGRPSVAQFVRSVAATSSLVTSFTLKDFGRVFLREGWLMQLLGSVLITFSATMKAEKNPRPKWPMIWS